MTFDGDAAFQLVSFRSTLRVVPEQLDGPTSDPALRQNRTDNLWEGLRRIYFGEQECEQVALGPKLSHQQIMENLRKEIAELEGRVARRRFPADSGPPPLPARREDDNDDVPPQSSMAHTNVGPERGSGLLVAVLTVPETPPSPETNNG